jgi:hypothetical protein
MKWRLQTLLNSAQRDSMGGISRTRKDTMEQRIGSWACPKCGSGDYVFEDDTFKANQEIVMALTIAGAQGETLFHDTIPQCFTPAAMAAMRAQVVADIEHFPPLDDDRIAILVGALLVENALDEFLRAFVPSYNLLEDNKDFTFSMRTNLGRSFRLCPNRIFGATDAIRNIRNVIAHHLEVTTIAQAEAVKNGLIASMNGHVLQFDPAENMAVNDRLRYISLSVSLCVAYRSYAVHARKLNQFIRSAGFMADLTAYCGANPG